MVTSLIDHQSLSSGDWYGRYHNRFCDHRCLHSSDHDPGLAEQVDLQSLLHQQLLQLLVVLVLDRHH
jgi:hypothetical protein